MGLILAVLSSLINLTFVVMIIYLTETNKKHFQEVVSLLRDHNAVLKCAADENAELRRQLEKYSNTTTETKT